MLHCLDLQLLLHSLDPSNFHSAEVGFSCDNERFGRSFHMRPFDPSHRPFHPYADPQLDQQQYEGVAVGLSSLPKTSGCNRGRLEKAEGGAGRLEDCEKSRC